jgi:hypothetical protein
LQISTTVERTPEARIGYLSTVEPEPFVFQLLPDPRMLALLRRRLRLWLGELEIIAADVASIVAACSEVVAAAIEGGAGAIEVTAEVAGADVVVGCTCDGSWAIETHPSRYVAALLVDHVSVETDGGSTAIVLRKALDRGLRSAERL